MSALFDRYLIVDWSAAGTPVRGANSIWWAEWHREGGLVARENPPTRAEAMTQIATRLADAIASGARVLTGFDFPFGYPAGFARRLGGDWRTLWARIEEGLEDAPDNTNNRFDLAGRFNA
ncbi:MAG: precorrin-8X methylmutase, partial [Pseudomonadota bacterium]